MRAPLFLTSLVASLAVSALAAAPGPNHVLHEKRDGQPAHWQKRDRAHPKQSLPVRIGLKQANLDRAHEFIMDVSDPESPNFGQHWSPEKVANTFMPAQETTDTIMDWLSEHGVDKSRVKFSTGRNWLEFDSPVHEVEKLLNTNYHYYEHQEGGFRVACDEYHVPHHVSKHLDFVMPTIQLDGLKPVANIHPAAMRPTNITGLSGTTRCDQLTTIDCLRALYGFNASTSAVKGNEMGIAEWSDFLYLPDLDPFFKNFTSPQIPAGTRPDFISIDGGQPSNITVAKAGEVVESALDFQTAYSIVYPQKLRLYQVGDGVNTDSVGTFNIFLDALDASYCTYKGGNQPYVDPAYPDPNEGGYTGPLQCGGAPLSNVFSFSYGQIEGALPRFYQERQCNEWMKLGLQGVSILFSSGDSGVANRYNSGYPNSCLNDKDLYVDNNGTRFSPSFPVNCPYVTAVGGTQLKGKTIAEGERAVAQPNPNRTIGNLDYYSGGGFSNVFPLPSYQKDAVQNYLQKYPPGYGKNVYNDTGNARGYPDVSAIGLLLATVVLDKPQGVGGTSASCPIVASLINLINEERLKAGKKSVGFLNPTFYKHPEAFNDITVGSNPGCGTDGFKAQPGWDPVTGLGTPKYKDLLKIFMDLP